MANWPAWFYGPNGEAEIFASEADVPDGWVDSPAQVASAAVDAADVEFVAAVPEAVSVIGGLAAKRGPGRPRKVVDDGDGA